jgi:4-hydroxy-3-polyprenylbenzoate decarboxylase
VLDYGYPVLAVATGAGQRVWREELDADFTSSVLSWQGRESVTTYPLRDIDAPFQSGRLHTAGMIVVPYSIETLSGIATGAAGNLIERAAEVTLKECRTLALVPRDTQFNAIHLENMHKLARSGVRIVSPLPASYLKPATMEDAMRHLVPRDLAVHGVPEAQGEPPAYVLATGSWSPDAKPGGGYPRIIPSCVARGVGIRRPDGTRHLQLLVPPPWQGPRG